MSFQPIVLADFPESCEWAVSSSSAWDASAQTHNQIGGSDMSR